MLFFIVKTHLERLGHLGVNLALLNFSGSSAILPPLQALEYEL